MIDSNKITNLTKPTYIYFHICCIGPWVAIINQSFRYMKEMGLYDKVDCIKCFLLGENYKLPPCLKEPKIKIIDTNPDIKLYERFTLNRLWDDCQKEDFNFFYIHSKGVSKIYFGKLRANWVKYMLYINCKYYKKIIEHLEKEYLTVGGIIRNLNKKNPFYAGNFWWSKSEYIRTLERTIGPEYADPEFWILTERQENKHINIKNREGDFDIF